MKKFFIFSLFASLCMTSVSFCMDVESAIVFDSRGNAHCKCLYTCYEKGSGLVGDNYDVILAGRFDRQSDGRMVCVCDANKVTCKEGYEGAGVPIENPTNSPPSFTPDTLPKLSPSAPAPAGLSPTVP